MAIKKTTIDKLQPDKRNANKHSTDGMKLLKTSISDNGFGRSILISVDNEIIAGNGVSETAEDKTPVRIIETDGKEIIAVKRIDIKSGTREFYKMAIADNVVADKNIVLDADVVEAIAVDYELGVWATEVLGSDDIPDVNRVVTFGEGANFIVKCKNIQELNKLQQKLNVSANSVSYDAFIKIYENSNIRAIQQKDAE